MPQLLGSEGSPYGRHASFTCSALRRRLIEPGCPPQSEGAAVTSSDLIVLVPWVIFGVAIAVICYLLLTRRQSPRRMRRARRRRPAPPPADPSGEDQAPTPDQDERPGPARPSR